MTAPLTASSAPTTTEQAASVAPASYEPLRDMAVKVHSSLKDSSFGVVRGAVGLAESLSSSALSYVPEPVVTKMSSIGNSTLSIADQQLNTAYQRIQSVISPNTSTLDTLAQQVETIRDVPVVDAAWFDAVEKLTNGRAAKSVANKMATEDFEPMVHTFHHNAAFQFLANVRASDAGAANGSSDDVEARQARFILALKAEVSDWNAHMEAPAKLYFVKALGMFKEALQAGDAVSITTYTVAARMRNVLNNTWRDSLIGAYRATDKNSRLIYALATQKLHDSFNQAITKLNASGVKECNGTSLVNQQEFLEAMREKLAPMWSSELEQQLIQLFAAWSDLVLKNQGSLGAFYQRYLALLTQAQFAFDRVLPSTDEQNKEVRTIGGLATHVADRVHERSIVSNVTTLSSNSVKETVNLAHTGARMASERAHSIVEPVMQRMKPFVDPLLERSQPVFNILVSQRNAAQQQLQAAFAQLQEKYQTLTDFLKSITAQATSTATNMGTNIRSQISPTVTASMAAISVRFNDTMKYAAAIGNDSGAQQIQARLVEMASSYNETAKQAINSSVHSVSALPERLGQLVEDVNVSLMGLKTSLTNVVLQTQHQAQQDLK